MPSSEYTQIHNVLQEIKHIYKTLPANNTPTVRAQLLEKTKEFVDLLANNPKYTPSLPPSPLIVGKHEYNDKHVDYIM
jgi:hypothetical protein